MDRQDTSSQASSSTPQDLPCAHASQSQPSKAAASAAWESAPRPRPKAVCAVQEIAPRTCTDEPKCRPGEVPTSRKPVKKRPAAVCTAQERAQERKQVLKDMLHDDKFKAYDFYDGLAQSLLASPAQDVLRDAIGQAYVDSFSISSSKPYGVAGEFNPTILRVKLLIDEVEEFVNRVKEETARGPEELRTCRRRVLHSQIWQQVRCKELHAVLLTKINKSENQEAIKGWLRVTREMTECMTTLTSATCGNSDARLEEDEDLQALQEELRDIALQSSTPRGCCAVLKREFGER